MKNENFSRINPHAFTGRLRTRNNQFYKKPKFGSCIENFKHTGLRRLWCGDEPSSKEMKVALEAVERGLLYIKIVKSDRSDYEPHFDWFAQYAEVPHI